MCPGQFARTSTNLTGIEVNDHVSLQGLTNRATPQGYESSFTSYNLYKW
jgi:hypothetical protein